MILIKAFDMVDRKFLYAVKVALSYRIIAEQAFPWVISKDSVFMEIRKYSCMSFYGEIKLIVTVFYEILKL